VSFSKLGGPQTRRFSLELSGGREGDIIRYTKDGSDPQPFSNSYAIPLIIDANTVIKAAIFRNDYLPRKDPSILIFLNWVET